MLKAVLPNGDALGPWQVWQQLPHPCMQHKLVQVPAQKTQAGQASSCTVAPSAGLCLNAIRGEGCRPRWLMQFAVRGAAACGSATPQRVCWHEAASWARSHPRSCRVWRSLLRVAIEC